MWRSNYIHHVYDTLRPVNQCDLYMVYEQWAALIISQNKVLQGEMLDCAAIIYIYLVNTYASGISREIEDF